LPRRREKRGHDPQNGDFKVFSRLPRTMTGNYI
jgi:hypothetical protein